MSLSIHVTGTGSAGGAPFLHPFINKDIIFKILAFTPNSVCALGAASRKFAQILGPLAQKLIPDIFAHCSTENTLVGRYILRIQKFCAPLGNDVPLLLSLRIHLAIGHRLRLLGGFLHAGNFLPHAGALLSAQDVNKCAKWIEIQQNFYLKLIWAEVRKPLGKVRPRVEDFPTLNEWPVVVRSWMHNNMHNSSTLAQSLTELNMSARDLECVPLELGLCTGLQKLDLSENTLTFLPEPVFQRMAELKSLNLSSNPLTLESFPEGVFAGLTGLEELKLSWTSLTSVPVGLFPGGLKRLSLAQSKIHSLPGSVFNGLDRLEELDISNNGLTSLPEELFRGLTSLAILRLHANWRLRFLPATLLCGLPMLSELCVGGIPQVSLPAPFFTGPAAPVDLPLLVLSESKHFLIPCSISYGPVSVFQLPCLRASSCQGVFQHLKNFDNMRVFSQVRDFFTYECQTPLAKFYQRAAGASSPEDMRKAFMELEEPVRTALVEIAQAEAYNPAEWGEHRLFEDMAIFSATLQRYVRKRFEGLSAEEKETVYARVCDLAQSELCAINLSHSKGDVKCSREHAFYHLLALIDATEQLREKEVKR